MSESQEPDRSTGKEELSLNLANIQTQWSMVRNAHQVSEDQSAAEARQVLVMRYAPAIRKFVHVVVNDPHLADELAQDALVRLLKGDFSGADPNRGRFRDLLKTAIRNMARNYWSKQKTRSTVDFDVDDVGNESPENQEIEKLWTKQCRDMILSVAWEKLQQFEQSSEDNFGYTALHLRSQHPDASSTELAALVSEQVGRAIKADNLRQQMRRARLRFAEFLVEEVAQGLDDTSPEMIHDELISLGLFSSVKDLLPKNLQSRNQ